MGCVRTVKRQKCWLRALMGHRRARWWSLSRSPRRQFCSLRYGSKLHDRNQNHLSRSATGGLVLLGQSNKETLKPRSSRYAPRKSRREQKLILRIDLHYCKSNRSMFRRHHVTTSTVTVRLVACLQRHTQIQRVAFPTHSRSVWDTTISRKILCVVNLNFGNSSLKFREMGVGRCGLRL